MHGPTIHSIIDRRVLVNYRVDPDVAARALPEPFRPRLVDGWAIGGICLIRLTDLRPPWAPRAFGITTENAAHRFAVDFGAHDHGVFVPRRDTSSHLAVILGGRAFPGVHHRADIEVHEGDGRYEISLASHDGVACVEVQATETSDLPAGSVFRTAARATEFFRHDPLGYSTTRRPGSYDCIERDAARRWSLVPLAVESVSSSMFDDVSAFPRGAAEFDSAFLMHDVDATWRPHSRMRAA